MKEGGVPFGLVVAGAGFGLYLLTAVPWAEPDAYPLDQYLSAELLSEALPRKEPDGRLVGRNPEAWIEDWFAAQDLASNGPRPTLPPLP